MGEYRHDFFSVVSDEYNRWAVTLLTEPVEELQKMFSGYWVESGTGLIEH